MLEQLITNIYAVREKTPLVHAITNYVTINDCANILLAAGASPAMCEAEEETYGFSQLANGVYLNIGTLTKEQEQAMLQALKGAAINNIPVVLDPVGCGAIPRKMNFVNKLLSQGPVTIVKGNLGEIKSLLGVENKVRGVDSIDEGGDGIQVCLELAKKGNRIVVATGEVDIVTDGERVCTISNGTKMLTRITGAGCMVGALTTALCGANEDWFTATCAAHLMMALAGELAAESPGGQLPGTFRANLMDQIYSLDQDTIMKRGRVNCY